MPMAIKRIQQQLAPTPSRGSHGGQFATSTKVPGHTVPEYSDTPPNFRLPL